jgi:lipid-A-disaccharide synthase
MSCDLFMTACEPSADVHGAALVKALLTRDPTLQIRAVAGPRMRELPIHCVLPMERLSVMGFTDIVPALPRICKTFFHLRRTILQSSPKAVVTIDYPGFNLRLQKALNRGYTGKQIHYICPTVWAWGKKRIQQMARTLDLGLAILPFEPACFAKTPLKMEYVGHPLTKAVMRHTPNPRFRESLAFSPSDKILALFPGSRPKEVERNLPLMLDVAAELEKLDPSLETVISSPQINTYDLMQNAHLALAKSGTVALELALHKTPTVVQYAIKPFDVFLATKLCKINLPFYSLPNLLCQTPVFPELFGPNLTFDTLLHQAKILWFEEEERAQCKKSCDQVWDILGTHDASLKAADKILSLI